MEMEHLDFFFFNRGFVHKSVCLCILYRYVPVSNHSRSFRLYYTFRPYVAFDMYSIRIKNGEVMYTIIVL